MRRVQNPLLYQQYIQLRETVARKYNKSVDDVETRPLWCFINKLDVESNTTWNYKQGTFITLKSNLEHESFRRNSIFFPDAYSF